MSLNCRGSGDGKRAEDTHRARWAFTLVELLVVIAIVALLLGILVPALAKGRRTARDLKCTSNLRQISVAWALYANDFTTFPVGSAPEYWLKVRWGWGGVHWYGMNDGGDPNNPVYFLPADRPVNAYIASDLIAQERAEVFRCPSDTTVSYARTGLPVRWSTFSDENRSGEGVRTAFGALGTSYEANDWMYCAPGAVRGFGGGAPPLNYRSKLAPHHVTISASRFIVAGDVGMMAAGRYNLQEREDLNIIVGWWHGADRGQMAFLDGSARHERVGTAVTQTYSYFMDPARHGASSWRRPGGP
jgi:prepilin-type N-terminal cleavage/methylation domain-containing protein